MRPLIGLNTSLVDMAEPLKAKAVCHVHYIDAVAGAGGVPVILPPYTDRTMLDEALAKLDGFCLIGGPDYDPAHYGGHAQPPDQVMHARRQSFDLWLAEALLERTRKPVLGICGGHQCLSIARGGALVQDLKTEWRPSGAAAPTLLHAGDERKGTSQEENAFRHEITLAPGSLIAGIVGRTSVMANSFHHQAVMPDRLGQGLVATGWAPDGVVEALELPGERFVLGVQWHPERLTHELEHRLIFGALVGAAGRGRN